jgi:thymidylate synthase (FAD)
MDKITPEKIIALDPYINAVACPHGQTWNPQTAIWYGQHTCVSEGFTLSSNISEERAGDAVVKHVLRQKHFSPLRFASLTIHFKGLPHDTVMQLCRHQDAAHLVQSMRYTGDRIISVIDQYLATENSELIEAIHYEPPAGYLYADRYGANFEYRPSDRAADLLKAAEGYLEYYSRVKQGVPKEVARRSLPSGYRQNMSISADLQAWLHILDQRTLADSQIECRAAAEMVMRILDAFVPAIARWYRENRHGKARLAP